MRTDVPSTWTRSDRVKANFWLAFVILWASLNTCHRSSCDWMKIKDIFLWLLWLSTRTVDSQILENLIEFQHRTRSLALKLKNYRFTVVGLAQFLSYLAVIASEQWHYTTICGYVRISNSSDVKCNKICLTLCPLRSCFYCLDTFIHELFYACDIAKRRETIKTT